MRKIIYTRPDGGVSVVHPVRNTHPRPEQLTDAQIEERAWRKLPQNAINPQFVDESSIPSDRTFRNAWVHGGNTINIDMGKARELHRKKLRELRSPILSALDTEYMRADELGDTTAKQRIALQKQALRDVTNDPAIDAAQTPEELKAVFPDILK